MILSTIGILAAVTLNQPAPALAANLKEALTDERYAQAYYRAGIKAWDVTRPLVNLERAEGNHIDAVSGLMKKYKVRIEPNPFDRKPKEDAATYLNRLGVPPTKEEGFAKAIKLEKAQGPLYDKLSVGMPDDVKQVFARLKEISLTRHLPALERALSGGGSGQGNGFGRGNGQGQGNGRGPGRGQGLGLGRGNPPR